MQLAKDKQVFMVGAVVVSVLAVLWCLSMAIPHADIWISKNNWFANGNGPASIADYPGVQTIVLGMSKEQVRRAIGNPKYVEPSALYAGAAAEVWRYNFFGWAGTATIVFGRNGYVIHRSFGNG